MLSRTAESLFWIGRYLERVEVTARVVDVAYHARLELDGQRANSADGWQSLLRINGETDRFEAVYSQADAGSVMQFTTFDETNPNSILSCLHRARESARGMRDRIASEVWETVNSFYLWLGDRDLLQRIDSRNVHDLYSGIKERCHLFQGIAQGTMVHDEGWHFLRVGSYLERAMMTAVILGVQHPILVDRDQTLGPHSGHQWIWFLRSLSAYEAYCKAFHRGIRPEWVAQFLVFDRTFPRSIRYAVGAAETSLKRISQSPPGESADRAERVLSLLQASIAFGDVSDVHGAGLAPLLAGVLSRSAQVSDELRNVYFAYRVPGASEA